LRELPKSNEDIIIYYFYKRILADLTDWLYRILFENTSKGQNISDLKGLEEDVISVINVMEKEENTLRRKAEKWITKLN